ncbi:MAG: DODA-type extradiol aromatic ring-opening family dioxygenase [Burkholderiaceae bacterium]
MALPTVFVSHGSPMHAVNAGRAGDVWEELGRKLPRPSAVLIASAHWETELPMVSTAQQPETIHDFNGFPAELYELRYPASGARDVAERAISLLRAGGLSATGNACRGIDHGAWVPLRRMYPNADVPVAQISIQPSLDAEHHLRLGASLAPLADDNVLIVGSGHITHNLREWMLERRSGASTSAAYVDEFRGWIANALEHNDCDALIRWRELAPHAQRAHPTQEHLLPLFVAHGAAGKSPRVERIDAGVEDSVLAMDAYVFWPQARDGS